MGYYWREFVAAEGFPAYAGRKPLAGDVRSRASGSTSTHSDRDPKEKGLLKQQAFNLNWLD